MAFSVTFALRLYNGYNHAHAPAQMWQSSPGLDSRCAKPCQCEIVSEEIQERKNYRECSNIKARVSVH